MKKAAVILLAAFYVLLSGGSSVCAMYCTTAKVVAPKVNGCCHEMSKMPMACHKPTPTGDDCTKKHGSFIVKENLKPSFSYQALKQIALVTASSFHGYLDEYNAIPSALIYQQSKAPPPVSGREYIIQLRTLLI